MTTPHKHSFFPVPYCLELVCAGVLCAFMPSLVAAASKHALDSQPQQRIAVAPNHRGFERLPSRKAFYPWGFNYGSHGRLIEDFWVHHWSTVARDFRNMRRLGANVVRVSLQYGKFMLAPDKPNPVSFKLLLRLLRLAETNRLHLDLTGLGCYRVSDTPKWYSVMNDRQRWSAQENFWRTIAATCARSHAVFCYDLINDPVVPGSRQKPGQWQPKSSFGGYDFLQFITLNPGHAERPELAVRWINAMTRAIRSRDKKTLITVGLLPWIPKWGWISGFIPRVIAPHVSFISIHIYPQSKDLNQAMDVLHRCAVGKPVVIEETFPLSCSAAQERHFLLLRAASPAVGWGIMTAGRCKIITSCPLNTASRSATRYTARLNRCLCNLNPILSGDNTGPGGTGRFIIPMSPAPAGQSVQERVLNSRSFLPRAIRADGGIREMIRTPSR